MYFFLYWMLCSCRIGLKVTLLNNNLKTQQVQGPVLELQIRSSKEWGSCSTKQGREQ